MVAEVPDPEFGFPRYVWSPRFETPKDFAGLQNTDPLVFGPSFLYSNCQQTTVRGPTGVRHLESGSIILFGSYLRGDFVLDTLFVVSRYEDFDRSDYVAAAAMAPSAYEDLTLKPVLLNLREDRALDSFRLYIGATPTDQLNGMFSFFPCVPREGAPRGFRRPKITLNGRSTPSMRQAKKLTPIDSLSEAKTLWDEVVAQTRQQGLMLGTRASVPGVL